jgi:hypothetical protein
MEKYCGKLQRAIASRRYPFTALDRFVMHEAVLTHLGLKFGITEELALCSPRSLEPNQVPGGEHISGCECAIQILHEAMLILAIDQSCALLYCSDIALASISKGTMTAIVASLATRFGV